ncbi:hypothetical protein D3C71_1685410 [compost metagenome]
MYGPHKPDVADGSLIQPFLHLLKSGQAPPVKGHIKRNAHSLACFDHGGAFRRIHGHGLFHIDGFARFGGG